MPVEKNMQKLSLHDKVKKKGKQAQKRKRRKSDDGDETETESEEDSQSESEDSSSEPEFVTSNSKPKKYKDGRKRVYGGDQSKLIRKYNRQHGETKMKGKSNRAKHGSSYLRLTTADEDQKAQTPDSILGELTERFGTTLDWEGALFDPCPAAFNTKGMRTAPTFDGLADTTTWGKVSYVNPPYAKIKLWFPKAIQEQAKGNTSVFLVPFRPFTRYFVEASKHISWLEVIYYGVGFRGYAAKIPHPMCTVVYKGKGVKDHPRFHLTQVQNKKHFEYSGDISKKTKTRRHTYVQRVDPPHAFDDATKICERNGISKKEIYIMINSSNMTNAGYLDDERIAKAKKSWKHAYALLVPFYNYSIAFQKAMLETTILAYSSPILSNYAGEGKCRFCSVLFVFCPEGDARFKKFVSDHRLHPFKMYFNFNGYMPTEKDLQKAKLEKIQKSKGLVVHKAGDRTVKGSLKEKRPKKKRKVSKEKTKTSKAKVEKKPKKAPPAEISKKPKLPLGDEKGAKQYVATFYKKHGKAPSFNTVRSVFKITGGAAKNLIQAVEVERSG